MGESRASKETRKRLEERDRQAEEDRRRLLAKAEEDSPLKKAVESSRLEDIEYFNQSNPDYSKAPKGLIDATAFQRAGLERLRSRTGTGGQQMGMYGSDPNLLALSREHQDARTAEEGAGAYASNLAQRRAEAYGGADASIGLNVQRALQLAGMSSQHAGQAGQNLSSFRPAPSLWSQLAIAGLGAAGQAAAAYMGKP